MAPHSWQVQTGTWRTTWPSVDTAVVRYISPPHAQSGGVRLKIQSVPSTIQQSTKKHNTSTTSVIGLTSSRFASGSLYEQRAVPEFPELARHNFRNSPLPQVKTEAAPTIGHEQKDDRPHSWWARLSVQSLRFCGTCQN